MAEATVASRRTTARAAAARAKQRRTKILVIVLLVALAALLAFQVPRMLKLLGGDDSSTSATSSPSATEPASNKRRKLPAILRGAGTAADPFAARALTDRDSGIAPGGGRDPFAQPLPSEAVSTPVARATLPQRIVIGTPGAHKRLIRGWIVILASIPVQRGHGSAAVFARRVQGLGHISILNSSKRRPLRGGYWVVYAGPVKTLSAVSRLAATVHAAGYRTAYIRELYQYR